MTEKANELSSRHSASAPPDGLQHPPPLPPAISVLSAEEGTEVVGDLSGPAGVRAEMERVYRLVASGRMTAREGGQLANILHVMHQIYLSHVHLRLDELERWAIERGLQPPEGHIRRVGNQ